MKAKTCSWCRGSGKEPDLLGRDLEEVCHSCRGTLIDTRWTSELFCPYCGEEQRNPEEYNEPAGDVSCGHCDKLFRFETEVTRTFDTTRMDCKNNLGPHQWKKVSWVDPVEYPDARHCRVCEWTQYKKENYRE